MITELEHNEEVMNCHYKEIKRSEDSPIPTWTRMLLSRKTPGRFKN